MQEEQFASLVSTIVARDPRYQPGAYHFVRASLDHTITKQAKAVKAGKTRHVSGPELLDGIRDHALEQFGPLSRTLLEHWGVKRSRDFGEIVFNLVEAGVFGKTDEDSRRDFDNVYDFAEAFEKPFEPSRRPEPLVKNRVRKAVAKPSES